CVQQQVQSLVRIERAEEGEDGFSQQTEPRGKSAVRDAWAIEGVAIDRIGNDGDLLRRDAAGDDIAAQAFADRRHRIGTMESVGLEKLRCSITQPGSAMNTVVAGRIFPEGAHFVDDWHPVPATGTD